MRGAVDSLIAHLPIPFFVVDGDFTIVARSRSADQTFTHSVTFIELVDEGSHDKAKQFLTGQEQHTVVELHLTDDESEVTLYDIHQSWHEGRGFLACIKKQRSVDALRHALLEIRERLDEGPGPTDEEKVLRLVPFQKNRDGADPTTQLQLVRLASMVGMLAELLNMLRPELADVGKIEFADMLQSQIEQALQYIQDMQIGGGG